MDLTNWLPSIATTSLLAVALWLSRKLIETRLAKSVEHEFNTKLEAVRAEFRKNDELLKADLRSREAEIAALRSGTMTAMASRQMALDKRRLEAVDQLWSAITALAPARAISGIMAVVKFKPAAEASAKNSVVRNVFEAMTSGLDIKSIDIRISEKSRPFVSPMAWALFSAYKTIIMQAVMKMQIIVSGVGTYAGDIIDEDAARKLVKAVLPDHESYVDTFGDAGYHYLLEEIERRILHEMQKMVSGVDSDRASIEQAAEILRLSTKISDSAHLDLMPSEDALQKSSKG